MVYVSEDELEEGEEYEVEYVDDEEYEKIMHQIGTEKKVSIEEVSDEEVENDIPLIPRFKKADKVATISAERVKDIQNAPKVVEDKKEDAGFIQRAVEQKERERIEETIQVDKGEAPTEKKQENKKKTSKKTDKKDEDIKTDEDGNSYVQATMKFDEDYEITEF